MSLLRDYIDGSLKNRSEGEISIDGFRTIAVISDNIKQTREAPTTYLEDGSHVNDHIIIKPVIVSIEGDISNVHVKPSPALRRVRDVESTFGAVVQYLPGRTQAQLSKVSGIVSDIQTQIDRVDELIRVGKNVAEFVGYTGREAKTNIENFIDKMNGLLESDKLINIDGPVGTYKNMCVISFEYTADNSSEGISFSLEAQELRFAVIETSEIAKKPDKKTNGQHAGETKKGPQEGKKVETSIFKKYIVNPIGRAFE